MTSRLSEVALLAIQEASILDAQPLRESLALEIRVLNDLIGRVHVTTQSARAFGPETPAAEVAPDRPRLAADVEGAGESRA